MSETERPIYLDYNATTPHDPEVVDAMRPFLETEFGNPSSSHAYGVTPRRAVARARAEVAALINARPEQILFTSGGTEWNNYAIIGAARDLKANQNQMRRSRDRLQEKLSVACEVRLSGHPEKRLPNTLNLSFRNITSNNLIDAIAKRVAVSAGSACHADSVTLSPVIEAIGVPIEWGRGTIRFSTGKFTTDEEIDQAAEAVITEYHRLAASTR